MDFTTTIFLAGFACFFVGGAMRAATHPILRFNKEHPASPRVTKFMHEMLFVAALLLAIAGLSMYPTNAAAGPKASRIGVYVDPDNGCEYLRNATGCLTPRIRANGSHICRQSM